MRLSNCVSYIVFGVCMCVCVCEREREREREKQRERESVCVRESVWGGVFTGSDRLCYLFSMSIGNEIDWLTWQVQPSSQTIQPFLNPLTRTHAQQV